MGRSINKQCGYILGHGHVCTQAYIHTQEHVFTHSPTHTCIHVHILLFCMVIVAGASAFQFVSVVFWFCLVFLLILYTFYTCIIFSFF